MRRTTTLVAALLAIILGSFAADSYAQGIQTGSIRGTVTDQQNLPVPGVTVTIQSPALQGIRTSVTAGDGSYSFVRLPPGRYEITFEITSFAPVKRTTDVLLGLSVEQNVTLTAAGPPKKSRSSRPRPRRSPTRPSAPTTSTTRSSARHAAQPAGHRAARARPYREHAERRPAHHQRRLRVRQRVHAEWRGRERQPLRIPAEPLYRRRNRGDAGSHLRYYRRVRPLYGRRRERRDQSGGNTFSGSFRTNFSNPSWTKTTPFERCETRRDRAGDLQAGGGAARRAAVHPRRHAGRADRARQSVVLRRDAAVGDHDATPLPQTNVANTLDRHNKRGEIKFTGTAASNHTFQGGYLNNGTSRPAGRPSRSPSTNSGSALAPCRTGSATATTAAC